MQFLRQITFLKRIEKSTLAMTQILRYRQRNVWTNFVCLINVAEKDPLRVKLSSIDFYVTVRYANFFKDDLHSSPFLSLAGKYRVARTINMFHFN